MPLNKFIPLSPDPNITRDSDMGMAQFGHLNTIVDYLNTYVAADSLQLDGTGPLSTTLRAVTDAAGNLSPLKISTTAVQVVSPLRITTDDPSDMYLDCEDGSTNNRFNITRNTASQQVNLNFASNPAGSTTIVGAVRTYVDGVNLSEVMAFREDGNIGIGTTAPTYKFMVSDNSANDGAVFFEKDLLGGQSDCYVYNKNASTNLTTGALIGTLSFGGYFNSTFSPGSQDVAAIFGQYTGTGTNRKGQLQFRTHDSSGMQSAMTINNTQLVGIGETSPLARLHIVGKGSTLATTSLLVQNSGGTQLFRVYDNGIIDLGTSTHVNTTGVIYTDYGTLQLQGIDRVQINNSEVRASANDFSWANNNFLPSNTTRNNFKFIGNGSSFTNGGASGTSIGNVLKFNIDLSTAVGDVTLNHINIDNTINTTAGTTLQRGFYYNPTLTLTTGFTHYGIQTTSGGAYINTTTPQASACLQADSTTQGFLKPRLTTAQKNAIVSPAAGLEVYDTDLNRPCFYSGSAWVTL